MSFICKRCGYEAKTKGNLVRHLQSKMVCNPLIDNINRTEQLQSLVQRERPSNVYPCSNCGRIYNHQSSLCKHKKRCREKQILRDSKADTNEEVKALRVQFGAQIIDLQNNDDKLQKENEILKQQIIELQQNVTLLLGNIGHITTVGGDIPMTKVKCTPKKKKIDQSIRISCWNKYIGEEIGKSPCICCKNIHITQHNFHCGHVVASSNGGSLEISNLRPICAICNNSMGIQDMREYAQTHFNNVI
jgi:hypothetical protein